MKFLLDMNVPPSLGMRLKTIGHEVRHALSSGLSQASDLSIIDVARKNNEIIVTHDLDYSHLMAFSGKPDPSVIIFRIKNTRPDNLSYRIINALERIEKPLREGCIVVIEDTTIRLRKLPIVKEET